jgi:phosphoglucosamine mutase
VALDARESFGDRIEALPTYPIRRDSVEVPDKHAVMERVEAAVTEQFDEVRTLDGVRVDLGDAWFLVRASGTQPLVRLTAEARDAGRAEDAFDQARSVLAAARE